MNRKGFAFLTFLFKENISQSKISEFENLLGITYVLNNLAAESSSFQIS